MSDLPPDLGKPRDPAAVSLWANVAVGGALIVLNVVLLTWAFLTN